LSIPLDVLYKKKHDVTITVIFAAYAHINET